MAYLGRISAVLTANTADFTRNIGDARREIQSFAQSARNIEVRLSTRALDESLTRLQRFTRTLDEIRDLQARGVDAGLPDPNRLRDQFRAYEDIGRGITRVKDSIEGLSTAAQAGLLPALEVLQSNFQGVYNAIRNGTTTYDEQRDRVEALRESLLRLTRQQSAVAAIGNAARRLDVDNTGASFVQPQALEALQRTLELRNQAEQVPARLRGSVFNELSIDAQRNADLIERQAARVSRALLDLGNGTGSRQAVQASQSLLDSLVQRQRAIIAQFETELRSVRITGVVDPEVGSEAENLTSRFETLSGQLRAINATRFDPLISAVGRIVEQFNRAATSADAARAAVNALAAVDVSENLFKSSANSIRSRLTTESERNREAINRAASQSIASIETGRNLPPPNAVLPSLANMQTTRDLAMVNARRDAGLAQEDFRSEFIPRVERIARDSIPLGDEFTNEATRIRREALSLSADLQNVFDAAGRDPVEAAAGLDRYRSRLEQLGAQVDDFEGRVRRASASQRQFNLFLRASGGAGDTLDPALSRAATDIVTARQFTGQFAEDNIAGRVEVRDAVVRAEQQILELTRRRAEIDEDANLTIQQRSARLSENSQQVRNITRELLSLVAASSGGIFNERQIQAAADRLAKSTGSISVSGFNNFNLAIQQGLFAVDDLISSTGPLEYKLRAVGNNISQLGLTLGQSGVIPWLTATRGLAIGLGAVLVGQLAVALIRYANDGKTAEDQAKALNDAFARQKSLVEELAQAFNSLGDSIARRAFSGPAQEARAFRKELDDIRKKQKELRDQRAFSLDEGVLRARADVNVAQRLLGDATTRDQAVAARRRLDDARSRLAEEEARVRNRPELTPQGTQQAVEDIFNQATERAAARAAQLAGAAGGGAGAAQAAAELARRAGNAARDRAQRRLGRADDPAEAVRALRVEQANAAAAGQNRLAAQLEELINRIQAEAVGRAADEFAVAFARIANRAASEIEQAQNRVADAIDAGVPGALELRSRLDRIGGVIDAATKEIADAQADFAESAQTDADAAARDARVRAAQQQVERSRADRNETQARARELDFRRIVDSQGLVPAVLDRARANLDAAQTPQGALARRQRELEAQRRQLLEDADSENPFVRRRALRGLEELDGQARALEAATLALRTFADGLNRASQVVQSDFDSARQDADAARRRDIGFSTQQSRRERAAREADLSDQRDAERRARSEIDAARARLESDVLARGAAIGVDDPFQRIRDINEVLSSGSVDAAGQAALIEERARLEASIQDLVDEFDQAAQAIADVSARRREVAQLAAEGRELALTPAQRAGETLARQLEALRVSFALQAEQTTGLIDQAGLREAQGRVFNDQIRQQAPLLAQFSDEVANAVLQGPSRAALQVSDASTVEGQRELNRLLRGDDPARDVNLIELQRQTAAVEELVRIARENGVFIANN